MSLTNIACRNAKPRTDGKNLRLADECGMYLEITPSGSKYWRMKYRFQGKEKRLALGVYPAVTLKTARTKRDEARRVLSEGIDPGQLRKVAREECRNEGKDLFEFVAREWFAKFQPTWAASHSVTVLRRMERDLFPWLGQCRVSEIDAPMLLQTLRRVEERGAIETAHRILQISGQVFRYAIATGRATRNLAADLKGALTPTVSTSFATLTDGRQIGRLLRAIDGYQGTLATRCALQLAPLVFVRPGELRKAEWYEIETERALWRIPAARMKMRVEHWVPLSRQALQVLDVLRPLTGSGRFVFPGALSVQRPMSENTVNAALRRLGYSGKDMTGHGFRHMACTLLNEQGWNSDAIERQLAHTEGNSVRATYNKARYLQERTAMMQAWADHLDQLRLDAPQSTIRNTD